MRSTDPIYGIACHIPSTRIRQAIRRMLRAIRRYPRDWRRVLRRVQAIEYLEPGREDQQTMGQWLVDPDEARRVGPQEDRPETWGRPEGEWHAAGRIKLSRQLAREDQSDLLVMIAHECGHAATREREFYRREKSGDSEWASELSADFYAARWGFERHLRRWAPRRQLGHHCGLPGQIVIEGEGNNERRYRVDRHFYLRRVK